MSTSFRRKIAVLLLAGSLAASWALAEPPRTLPGPDRAGTFEWARLDLLTRFWNALTSLWGENGCSVDPFGRCIPGTRSGTSGATTTGDAGCSVDPNGRCIPGTGEGTSGAPTTGDAGCSVDPFGRCID